MSWTHVICEEDFYRQRPDLAPDGGARMKPEYRVTEPCCWCGRRTDAGLYFREDQAALPMCSGHDG